MSFVKTLPGTVVEVVPTDTVANGEAFVPSFTASITFGVAVDVLFPGVGSVSFPEIVAVFAHGPVAVNVATTLIVADAPLAKFPIVQVGADQVPVAGVALTRVYPAGMQSVTLTPVAADGPLFVAVIVKVTLLPTAAPNGETVLVTDKSASTAHWIGFFTFTTVVVVLEQPALVKLYVTVWLPLVLAAKLITPVEALILKPASEVNVPPDAPDTVTAAVPVGQNGPPGYEIVAIGNGLITTTTGLIVSHKFNEACALPFI